MMYLISEKQLFRTRIVTMGSILSGVFSIWATGWLFSTSEGTTFEVVSFPGMLSLLECMMISFAVALLGIWRLVWYFLQPLCKKLARPKEPPKAYDVPVWLRIMNISWIAVLAPQFSKLIRGEFASREWHFLGAAVIYFGLVVLLNKRFQRELPPPTEALAKNC